MVSLKTELETKVDDLKKASDALLAWAINAEQALLMGQTSTYETDEDILTVEVRG